MKMRVDECRQSRILKQLNDSNKKSPLGAWVPQRAIIPCFGSKFDQNKLLYYCTLITSAAEIRVSF
jgi:hypothetical protein